MDKLRLSGIGREAPFRGRRYQRLDIGVVENHTMVALFTVSFWGCCFFTTIFIVLQSVPFFSSKDTSPAHPYNKSTAALHHSAGTGHFTQYDYVYHKSLDFSEVDGLLLLISVRSCFNSFSTPLALLSRGRIQKGAGLIRV